MLKIGTGWLNVWIGELLNSGFGPSRVVAWLSYRPSYQIDTFVGGVAQVIISIIIGPVIEELLFRGLLLHRWAVKWSVSTAIVVSSLLFALFHMDVWGAFIWSLLMTVVYIRTRTLVVNILIHALYNALVLISGQIYFGNVSTWLEPFSLCFSLPIVLGLTYKYWPKQNSSLPYFSVSDPLVT
jgi:membrane protease YdiL (CAAX protease family)